MSRRRWTLWVVVDGPRLLVKGWRAGDLLRAGGWRPIYGGSVKAWMIDARHLDDVVAYIEYRGAVAVVDRIEMSTDDQIEMSPNTVPVSPEAVEEKTSSIGDLLTLIADDERHDDDYHRFVAACRADADALHGRVSVNRVRALLSNQYGLEVEPRRYSAYWNRATKAGPLLNTEEWEVSTDTRGRNVGKPQRVREWRGWASRSEPDREDHLQPDGDDHLGHPERDLFGEVVA